MFSYRFDVILPYKYFTWTGFGRVYIPYISPVATPLTGIKHLWPRQIAALFIIPYWV